MLLMFWLVMALMFGRVILAVVYWGYVHGTYFIDSLYIPRQVAYAQPIPVAVVQQYVPSPAPIPAPPKVQKPKPERFQAIRYHPGTTVPIQGNCHLDEDTSDRELRRLMTAYGLNVSHTHGDLKEISDKQQIEFARRRRAVILTHDKGLYQLAASMDHCGVVWSPSKYPVTELAQFCSQLWGSRVQTN